MSPSSPFDQSSTPRHPGVLETVDALRQELGTYSIYKLGKDVQRLLVSDDADDQDAKAAATHYQQNKQEGIPPEIVDWIIRSTLPQAPEGYVSIEASRLLSGSSYEMHQETIAQFARIHGVPDTTLKNMQDYKTHAEKIQHLFMHGRSQGNGGKSVFFSPEAQKEIARMIKEHQRDANKEPKPSAQDVKPTRTASATFAPLSERASGHEAGIEKLRARLEAVLPDLHPHERIIAEGYLVKCIPSMHPTDAIYTAGEIKKLEETARQNRDD